MSQDKLIAGLLIVLSIFLATNFSSTIGLLYLGMTFAYAIAVIDKYYPDMTFIKNYRFDFKMIVVPVVLVGFWMYLSGFVISWFEPSFQVSPQSVIQLLSTQSTPPLVIDDSLLKLFVWGFFIPLVETAFFLGYLLPLISKKLVGVKLQVNRLQSWYVFFLISTIFSLFHLVATSAQSYAMMADFIFMVISAVVVTMRGDLLYALLLHIIANTVIMAGMLGMIKW